MASDMTLYDLLGVEKPIICGAMAWIGTHKLGIPVVENGCFFFIGTGNADGEWVRNEINAIVETGKPFGVNILGHSPNKREVIEVILKEADKITAVSLSAFLKPDKQLVGTLKEKGLTVIPLTGRAGFAPIWEKVGADGIIAESRASGGHIGPQEHPELLSEVLGCVSIPVIAAGGFYSNGNIQNALGMGAIGIQLGSRFAASEESPAHDNYKQAIISGAETAVCGAEIGPGYEVRALSNPFTERFKILAQELSDKTEKGEITKEQMREELNEFGTGAVRKGLIEGDLINGSLLIGEVVRLITKIQPVAEIITELTT